MKIKSKTKIFSRISESLTLQILVCLVLCAIIIISFFIYNRLINNRDFHKYTITDDINLVNSLEEVNIENGNIILDGYAFLQGQDSNKSSISLFLLGVESGNEIWADIEQVERTDVNEYFLSEYNYKVSGFRASLKNKKLSNDESYEIMINIDYNKDKDRITVSSDRFILNGQLYSYNPLTFDKPETNIQSELLSKVFNEGKLCAYQKEDGMYIYLYDDKLYWIASNDFNFNNNGQSDIQYLLCSTQYKVSNGKPQYDVDNRGFVFEQFEYKDEATEPYRVAIREIPNDYDINFIMSGHYERENDTWLWHKSFRLDNLTKRKS